MTRKYPQARWALLGDVSGSIFCTIEVIGGSLTSISLSYATPNGNDVSINFTFQY